MEKMTTFMVKFLGYFWFFFSWGALFYGLAARDWFWFILPVLMQAHWAMKIWIAECQLKMSIAAALEKALAVKDSDSRG